MQLLPLNNDCPGCVFIYDAIEKTGLPVREQIDILGNDKVLQVEFKVNGHELPFAEMVRHYFSILDQLIENRAANELESRLFKMQMLLQETTEKMMDMLKDK